MRKTLAALAFAALLPVPSASAHHVLLPYCGLFTQAPPVKDACVDVETTNYVLYGCDAVALFTGSLPEQNPMLIFGATSYFPQAAQIRTLCYQPKGPGTAAAEITLPGPLAAMPPHTAGVTVFDPDICTKWFVRFEPGNSYGYDPALWYNTAPSCHETSGLALVE